MIFLPTYTFYQHISKQPPYVSGQVNPRTVIEHITNTKSITHVETSVKMLC